MVEVVFTMTCPACGEAYDATDLAKRDAYLTLASKALASAAGMDDSDVFVSIEDYYDYDNEVDSDLSNLGWAVPNRVVSSSQGEQSD